jgi:hypothetical protein
VESWSSDVESTRSRERSLKGKLVRASELLLSSGVEIQFRLWRGG